MENKPEILVLDTRSNLWVMRLGENENVPLYWKEIGTFQRGNTRYVLYAHHDVSIATARAIIRAYHEGLLEQNQPLTYSWEL